MYRILTLILGIALAGGAAAADIDWGKVDQAIGKPGTTQPGGVHKYGLPRSDLTITVDGVAIKPTFALGSWIGFLPMGTGVMFMGDLVLTEREIEPVMKRLVDDGVEITAIHNHLLRTSPAVFYMHVGGHGDPVKLAQTLHAGLALSQTPFTAAAPAATPPTIDLDTAAIDAALEAKGTINGGVYQFNIPRAEPITEAGMAVPPSMGTAIGIEPEPVIPPYVREPIRADRFEIGQEEKPVPLDAGETRDAVAVVCIMCKLPPGQLAVARQSIEWTDVPDVSDGYAAARDRILGHMKELMVRLGVK
jgi:hypothetical protein